MTNFFQVVGFDPLTVTGGGGGGGVTFTDNGDGTETLGGSTVGYTKAGADSKFAANTDNLSALASKPTARNNLGVHASITPQQYGATGNGTIDDTTAFQNAINAATAAGVELVVPPGTYLVTNLGMGTNAMPLKMRGLHTVGMRFPTKVMPVTLKNKAGSTTPIITFFRGCEIDSIGFDGNGTSPTGGLVYGVTGLEIRLRSVDVYNCAAIGLLLSGCDNVYFNDVHVDNCGSTSLPAMRIESYYDGTVGQQVCNTVIGNGLTIERSQNCGLDIGTGTNASQKDYVEFVLINNLHVEGATDNGGLVNAGPLIKIGNVRDVMVDNFLIFGGPGALVDYTAGAGVTSSAGNAFGGVHLSSGVLLGQNPAIATTPAHLVTLGGGSAGSGIGDGFTMQGVTVDFCTGGVVSIASTFGANVQIGAVFQTPQAPILLDDARSKLGRRPYDPGPTGHTGRARKVLTGSGRWLCVPGAVSTATPTLDYLTAHRLVLDTQVTVTGVAAEVTTGIASGAFRIGIFADSNGVPGELLYDSGALDGTTAAVKSASLTLALYPGAYWLAVVAHGAAPTMRAVTPSDLLTYATATLSLQNPITGWAVGCAGALPSPWVGGDGYPLAVPRVALQIA